MEKNIKSNKAKINTNTSRQVLKGYAMRILSSILLLLCMLLISTPELMAQCALCTKTAQQLGDGPAAGLNKGILYLMVIPISILSIIGFKWYKKEKVTRAQEDGEQQ